jgi:hypothetical protein
MSRTDKRTASGRSRHIRDLNDFTDKSFNSIASSTGSKHGTITVDLTGVRSKSPSVFEHSLASFNFSELDPDDEEIFSSTNIYDYPLASKLPELRDTAKKYGRWSPRREPEASIGTSVMNNAFKGFTGTLPENTNNNTDTFNLEPPKGTSRNKYQPSPTPASGDDNSYFGTSRRMTTPVDQNKENTPLPKHSAQKSAKGSAISGSPYISYASRTVNGQRRTLTELHAQVADGSENSLLIHDRTNTITLPSKSSRFAKTQTTTTTSTFQQQAHVSQQPVPQSRLQTQASSKPTSYEERQGRKPSTTINPAPLAKSLATITSGNSLVQKTSPVDAQQPPRRHSDPQATSVVDSAPALEPEMRVSQRLRSNSNPTLLTQTFVIPPECSDKTKPIDPQLPVIVHNGQVEAPPRLRRRVSISGIVIPDDEEELYRMIVNLHTTIISLEDDNQELIIASKDGITHCGQLDSENRRLKTSMRDLRQANDSLESELKSAKGQIDSRSTESNAKRALQEELNSAKAEIEFLVNQSNANNGLESELNAAKAEIKFLLNQSNANNGLESELNAAKAEIKFLLSQSNANNGLASELNSAKAHIEYLVTQSIETNIKHKTEINVLKTELTEMRRVQSELQSQDAIRRTSTSVQQTQSDLQSAIRRSASNTHQTQSRPLSRASEISTHHSPSRPQTGRSEASSHQSHSRNFTSAYILEDIERDDTIHSRKNQSTHTRKEQPALSSTTHPSESSKDRPVLSSNARQVLDGLCEHNCPNCKICARVSTFKIKPCSKRAKQTVRVERPTPVSQLNLESAYEGDEPTLRPAQPPAIALASVLKGLNDELKHLKRRYTVATNLYTNHDAPLKRAQMAMITEEMDQLKEVIGIKTSQIYDLYDVLEGQLQAGQTMEEEYVDITVVSERDFEDEIPFEAILDLDR